MHIVIIDNHYPDTSHLDCSYLWLIRTDLLSPRDNPDKWYKNNALRPLRNSDYFYVRGH